MQLTSRFGKVVNSDGILVAILIGSRGLNVYLGVSRNRAVAVAPNHPDLLAPGSQAPAFEGTTLTGGKVKLDYGKDARNTLLYVFSPTCHWCERNLPNIKAIIAARQDLHVVGVYLGPKLDLQSAAGQPFTDVLQPTPQTASAYHLTGTPATLLISPDGKVVNSWSAADARP